MTKLVLNGRKLIYLIRATILLVVKACMRKCVKWKCSYLFWRKPFYFHFDISGKCTSSEGTLWIADCQRSLLRGTSGYVHWISLPVSFCTKMYAVVFIWWIVAFVWLSSVLGKSITTDRKQMRRGWRKLCEIKKMNGMWYEWNLFEVLASHQ